MQWNVDQIKHNVMFTWQDMVYNLKSTAKYSYAWF